MFLSTAPVVRLRDTATPETLLKGLRTLDGICADTIFIAFVDEGTVIRKPLAAAEKLIAWDVVKTTPDGKPAHDTLVKLLIRFDADGGAYDPDGRLLARAEAALAAARAA